MSTCFIFQIDRFNCMHMLTSPLCSIWWLRSVRLPFRLHFPEHLHSPHQDKQIIQMKSKSHPCPHLLMECLHSTAQLPFLQPWENNNGVEFVSAWLRKIRYHVFPSAWCQLLRFEPERIIPFSILKGVQPKFICLQPPNSFHFPSSFLSVKGQNDACLHIRLVIEPVISFTTSATCVVGHSSPGFHHAPCK